MKADERKDRYRKVKRSALSGHGAGLKPGLHRTSRWQRGEFSGRATHAPWLRLTSLSGCWFLCICRFLFLNVGACGRTFTFHQFNKAPEMVGGIVWTGCSFRMVLNRDDGQRLGPHPFDAPVIKVDMGDFHFRRQTAGKHSETVIV